MDRLYIFFMFIPIVSFHGFFQAWVAQRLGDTSARDEGRLTLNPLPHIDPWGTLLIPALSMFLFQGGPILIGWGKPIPVNPYALSNPRRDELLIALAGPFSNFILGFAILLLGKFTASFAPGFDPLIIEFATISIFLSFFYLLPFPWFEGWTVVRIIFNFSVTWMEQASIWWWLGLIILLQFTPLINIIFNLTRQTIDQLRFVLGLG